MYVQYRDLLGSVTLSYYTPVHSALPFTGLLSYCNCSDPGTPTNGQRSLSSTAYNSVVTYTCNVGYTLQGSNNRTCQSDGQWNGSMPQCTKSMFLQTFAVTNCLAWSALKLAGQTFGFFAGYKYNYLQMYCAWSKTQTHKVWTVDQCEALVVTVVITGLCNLTRSM